MFDAVEVLLVSLAVALGGAAFAIGTQLIRAAWRDARPAPLPKDTPAPPERNPLPRRGIATFMACRQPADAEPHGGGVPGAAAAASHREPQMTDDTE